MSNNIITSLANKLRTTVAVTYLSASIPFSFAGTAPSSPTPEQAFGLKVEQTGIAAIKESFDMDAFYKRVLATLPTTEKVKQAIQSGSANAIVRKRLLIDVAAGLDTKYPIRYLGVRQFENETELLFTFTDFQGASQYCGYVPERSPTGGIKLVDVHSFEFGELKSQSSRRETLLQLAENQLVSDQANARDKAFASGLKEWKLFTGRVGYGKFDLTKQAYEKLPLELQNDRGALCRYVRSAVDLKSLLVPINRWRELYPDDPSPEVMLVDAYWALYYSPHVHKTDKEWIDAKFWDPEQATQVSAAVIRANAWLQDPAQEVRLARSLMSEHVKLVKPLLEPAIKRVPPVNEIYDALIAAELAEKNYDEVGRLLPIREAMFQTNLTIVVNASADYAGFRKSLAWKRWQHDIHNVDLKSLVAPSAN